MKYTISHIEAHSDSRKNDDYHSNRRCSSSRAVLIPPVRIRWIRHSKIWHTIITWNDAEDRDDQSDCLNDCQSSSLKIQKLSENYFSAKAWKGNRHQSLASLPDRRPTLSITAAGLTPARLATAALQNQISSAFIFRLSNVAKQGFAPRSQVWSSAYFQRRNKGLRIKTRTKGSASFSYNLYGQLSVFPIFEDVVHRAGQSNLWITGPGGQLDDDLSPNESEWVNESFGLRKRELRDQVIPVVALRWSGRGPSLAWWNQLTYAVHGW